MNRKFTPILLAVMASVSSVSMSVMAENVARKSFSFPGLENRAASDIVKRGMHAAAESETRMTAARKSVEENVVTLLDIHPTKEEFDAATVISANTDANTLEYYYAETSGGKVYDWPIFYENKKYGSDKAVAADEWFIVPFTVEDATMLCRFSVWSRRGVDYTPEAFDVFVGNAPTAEGMTMQVLDEPIIIGGQSSEFSEYSCTFGVDAPGTYYLGLHVKSGVEGWRIMFRDLLITASPDYKATPKAPVIESVVPDGGGALQATVMFTYPDKAVNGQALVEDVTVKAESAVDSQTLTGAPGSRATVTLKCNNGENVLSLTSYVGESAGATARTRVVCGIDVPVDPVVKVTESADNMSMMLSWEPVSEGANGGIVVPADVKYNVYRYMTVSDEGGTQADWVMIAEGLSDTEYLFRATEQAQQSYTLSVSAWNSVGESVGEPCSLGEGRLGNLYGLPCAEDFSTGTVACSGYMVDEMNGDVTWQFAMSSLLLPSAGDVGALIAVSGTAQETIGAISLPKMKCGDGAVQASFKVFVDRMTAHTDVVVIGQDGTESTIGTIVPGDAEGWQMFRFNVPSALSAQPWCYVALRPHFVSASGHFILSGFEVRSMLPTDVKVDKLSVSRVRVGGKADVSFTVTNYGSNIIENPEVDAAVYLNGEHLFDMEHAALPATLQSGESVEVKAGFGIDTRDYENEVMEARVAVLNSDDDMDNNTAALRFRIYPSPDPVVGDLTGHENAGKDGVVLSWSNPVEEVVNDSFEFLEHGDYGSRLGAWLNVDFDRKNNWGVDDQNAAFPAPGVPKAFQVINSQMLGSRGYNAHSGEQYLIAFSAQEAQSDDWLISEELDGSQGISFWLGTLTGEFEETLEVMASSTDRELDSFSVVNTVRKQTYGWEWYHFDLPEDTKYVAFHYVSNDKFCVMLDDVCYTPAENAYSLTGFNIYRNGELIKPVHDGMEFEDIHEGYGTNVYHVSVSAVHEGAEQEFAKSNSFSLNLAGIESVDGVSGTVTGDKGRIIISGFRVTAPVAVCDTAGRTYAAGTLSDGSLVVTVPAGVYLLRIDGVVYKVSVR